MYALAIIFTYISTVAQLKHKELAVEINDRLRCCLYIGLGMLLGARLGQFLFYNLSYFLSNPLSIPAMWRGGMSSHGAFIGVVVAVFLCVQQDGFYKRTGLDFLQAMDIIIPAVPFGLGLIRIGNFINGSLYGRASDLPWAMIFPDGGLVTRHPSQIYQFLLEGIILFLVFWSDTGIPESKIEEHRCYMNTSNTPEHCGGNIFRTKISDLEVSKKYYFNVIARDINAAYYAPYKKIDVTTYINFDKRTMTGTVESGEYKFYGIMLDAPSSVDPAEVTIKLSGRGIAQNLYVSKDNFPEFQFNEYDCEAETEYPSGNTWEKKCVYTLNSPTMVYILVHGNGEGEFSLSSQAVSLVSAINMTPTIESFSGLESKWRYHKIPFALPTSVDVRLTQTQGNTYLYTQVDNLPDADNSICSSESDTN